MSTFFTRFPSLLVTVYIVLFPMAIQAQTSRVAPLPEGFSYLEEIIPNIRIELHYYAENNFIGAPIDGYLAPKGIMTTKAAHALKKSPGGITTIWPRT